MCGLETAHLWLSEVSGLVRLKCPGEPEDLPLGHLGDDSDCPAEYRDEWRWLREEMEDRYRFGDACRHEALTHDLDSRNWR